VNSFYPIMLQLAGKKVAVIGGGKVAERKVTGLLGTGALITVISPDATEELKKLADEGKIVWQPTPFSPADVKDALLIFAATNDNQLNQLVKASAEQHQLVTVADAPEESDFHLPSKLKRGRLTIAVSTGGASPMLARKIRANLEQQFDQSYEDYLEFLFAKRQWILKEVADPDLKRKLLIAIVSEEFLTSGSREEDFQRLYEELS
jgi:precorrin-2 dehydrogenase/sirohydrochlorin ferrochelatase